MAAAYQCDRCKKFFNEKNVDGSIYPYIVDINKSSHGDHILDLCSTCKEKLISWINVKENA